MQYLLLVFDIVFYNPIISRVLCIKGWMGGRRAGVARVGEQAEGRLSLSLGHRQCAVFSVGDWNVHKPQDRSRQPLAVVWHPTNSD